MVILGFIFGRAILTGKVFAQALNNLKLRNKKQLQKQTCKLNNLQLCKTKIQNKTLHGPPGKKVVAELKARIINV
jgi:hypothetical protein